MKRYVFTAIAMFFLLASCVFFPGIVCADGEINPPVTTKKIIFFYGTDSTGARGWVDWLASEGFMANRFKSQDADSVDISATDLVIIGSDTFSNWSDKGDVFGIIYSGKPVLGIGSGGAKYLMEAGAGTGGNWAPYTNLQAVHMVDSGHAIYNLPNILAGPDVYACDYQRSGVSYKISDLPGNVTVLGNDSSSSSLDWALITSETSKYTTWGFNSANPNSSLNVDGRMLLENVIWFALGGYPVPEFDDRIFFILFTIFIVMAIAVFRMKESYRL